MAPYGTSHVGPLVFLDTEHPNEVLRFLSSLAYSIVLQERDIASVSEAISKPYRRASEAGRLLRHFVPRNIRNLRDRIYAYAYQAILL